MIPAAPFLPAMPMSSTAGGGGNYMGHNTGGGAATTQNTTATTTTTTSNSTEDKESCDKHTFKKIHVPADEWDQVKGMDTLKQELEAFFIKPIIYPLLYQKLFKGNILFYGPPGTGKSFLTRTLSAHLQEELQDVARKIGRAHV